MQRGKMPIVNIISITATLSLSHHIAYGLQLNTFIEMFLVVGLAFVEHGKQKD